jgi:hypothetical protein
MRAGIALLTLAAIALPPAAARADEAKPLPDPSWYVDPSYDPSAHGGLPYATYLRMTRGTARRSTGMMATGIVLTGVGVSTLAIGTGLYVADHCSQSTVFTPDGSFNRCSQRPAQFTGMAIMVTGTITMALGLPLWIAGASQVPWAEASGANDRAAPKWARLVPAVTPATAGHGVALHWRF